MYIYIYIYTNRKSTSHVTRVTVFAKEQQLNEYTLNIDDVAYRVEFIYIYIYIYIICIYMYI